MELDVISRANLLANVVLFAPIGFFATGAALGLRVNLGRGLATTIAVLSGSFCISAAIEAFQVLVPSRTPSLLDVGAHSFGTAVGIVVWLLVAGEVRAWIGNFASRSRLGLWQAALLFYAAVRGLVSLMPLDVTVSLNLLARKYRHGGIILRPFASEADLGTFVQALASDMVLLAPIGALAVIAGSKAGMRRSVIAATLLGTLFVAALELAQVFVISRTADVTDVLTGSMGVLAGAWMAARLSGLRQPRAGQETQHRAAAVGLALWLVAYVGYHWSPFNFGISPESLRSRLALLLQIPFHSHYVSPELQSLADGLMQLAVAAPIGWCATLAFPQAMARYRRSVLLLLFAAALAFFMAVELGQAFLPSRHPDNTDVLLALCGFLAGVRATRHLAG